MSHKRNTGFFQLHLLTVIVMSLVAGALVGLNVCRQYKFIPESYSTKYGTFISDRPTWTFGWPADMVRVDLASYKRLDLEDSWVRWDRFPPAMYWRTRWLVVDVLTTFALIVAGGVACEALLRRRERRANLAD